MTPVVEEDEEEEGLLIFKFAGNGRPQFDIPLPPL